jgi:LSD1 subclass zinc finger protein
LENLSNNQKNIEDTSDTNEASEKLFSEIGENIQHDLNEEDALISFSPWVSLFDDDGDTYYYNEQTKETSWDKPGEEMPRMEDVLVDTTEELSNLTVVQLKIHLKELGLSTSGNKAELINRLAEANQLNQEEEDEEEPESLLHWQLPLAEANQLNQEEEDEKEHDSFEGFSPPPPNHKIIRCNNCDSSIIVPKGAASVRCPDCKTIRHRKKRKTVRVRNKKQIDIKMMALLLFFILISAVSLDVLNEGPLDEIFDTTPDDSDGDGLTDTREWDLGTDSTDPDTDGDGLSDAIEVSMGTDPLDPDTDDDGYRDNVDLWPLSDWALEVTWSGWEVEDNEVCASFGSKAMRWSVSGTSGEHSFDDSGSSSGTFYFDMPDDNENEVKSITFTVDATYTNCPLSNEAQLFWGFTCLSCSDPGPAGTGYAIYLFSGIDSSYEDSQSIIGSRSSEDFRAEGWLSGSTINLKSVFL